MEMNGFWLPRDIQAQLINAETPFSGLSFRGGRECPSGTPGSVHARWVKLNIEEWRKLIAMLKSNRQRVPRGEAYWQRLQRALQNVADQLNNPQDALSQKAIAALPVYSGFSEEMIAFTMQALELIELSDLPQALKTQPTWRAARQWQALLGLPGWLRFYPQNLTDRLHAFLPGSHKRSLFTPAQPPALITGYAAGNVPGTALLMCLLAQAAAPHDSPPPALIIKNSRREPIFSAMTLSALEEADPDLFASTAVLVWDYEEIAVQELLLPQTDLVIAAASDPVISRLQQQLHQAQPHGSARFHAHGHKVSFSAISKTVLQLDLLDLHSGIPLLDIVALLAGLDSIFWDQFGCLSARIHFVEDGCPSTYNPLTYAQHLNTQLSLLSQRLPRGDWPRQQLHTAFDRYKALEASWEVQVCSAYDDEFLVVYDARQVQPQHLYQQINECQGRIVIVKPVSDLMEIPQSYLRYLPAQNLQSLSVALGAPGAALTQDELDFAQACGACGVTAIRTVGRGAFPQLAYSWDGLLPLDLLHERPSGYFTTIEFDQPYQQILETFHLLIDRKDMS